LLCFIRAPAAILVSAFIPSPEEKDFSQIILTAINFDPIKSGILGSLSRVGEGELMSFISENGHLAGLIKITGGHLIRRQR